MGSFPLFRKKYNRWYTMFLIKTIIIVYKEKTIMN